MAVFTMEQIMKTNVIRILVGCVLSLSLSVCLFAEEHPKTILVHYMPWYDSKPISGNWGWHWTMDRFAPEKIKKNGQREVASHYYPLIGPYDSNDPDALEYHVLLMKLSGIDGVIVDWYGIKDFHDYGPIHRNTQHLVKFVKKAGLKFAVCYEDRTIIPMVNTRNLKATEDVLHAAEVMKWLDKNWFSDDAYVRIKSRPILPVFGPMYFKTVEQWKQIFAEIPTQPVFYALPHLAKSTGSDGAFGWPPVHGGKEITPATWKTYLSDLYARKHAEDSVIAVVFPKFHDIYEKSYGYIDDRDGKTFEETLELSMKSEAALVQIATWNDYGEGTIIEPTVEFGYRYLESLQKHKARKSGKTFQHTADDLRLPLMLYTLRKQTGSDRKVLANLDVISDLLFASKCNEAKALIEKYQSRIGEPSPAGNVLTAAPEE